MITGTYTTVYTAYPNSILSVWNIGIYCFFLLFICLKGTAIGRALHTVAISTNMAHAH